MEIHPLRRAPARTGHGLARAVAARGALPRPLARRLRHRMAGGRRHDRPARRRLRRVSARRLPAGGGPVSPRCDPRLRGCRLPRHRVGAGATPQPATDRDPAGGLRLRNPRRRQRDAPDYRHHAAGLRRRSPARLRSADAERQLVELSTAQARRRRSAARSRPGGDLLFPLPGPARLRLPSRLYGPARRHRPRDPWRRRRGSRRLPSVRYRVRLRRILSERSRRHASIDGRDRRPGIRPLPTRVAGARSAPAAREKMTPHATRQRWREFMKRTLHGLLATVAVFLLLVPAARAQVDRATLSGVVKDSGGGVVPGATVLVTNLATNVEAQQTTTETGSYQIVNLIPGRYRVDVELSGFKKSSQVITLEVSQRARVDVELAVGSLAETVTVTETAQLLNANDATLGAVIPQVQVSNLPLAIRNWDDLLALVPGVQGDRYTEQGGGTSFGRTGGINVHGARALQNNFLLDGVDNNSISENVQELTTQVSRPSVDAIQEFKVVTSPYSAEYGRSPGAAVSVSTKSGTNAFHGTGYEYFRNQAMDSIDFFSKRAGVPKPDNRQNQPGGNLGGPILKNRAFFFADYEGTRITRGVSRLTRVPTADERNGLFSAAVKDPVTGQNFANNQIPANRIDPFAAAILALVPMPNVSGVNNFFRNANLIDNSDRLLTRLDWRPSTKDSVFGRYIYSNRDREIPGAFGGVIDGTGTSAFGNQTIATNAIVGGWTRVLSARMVNEARFSWSRSRSDAVHQAYGLTPPPAAQIPGMITDPIVAGGFPGISITGYFGGSGLGRLGSPDFLPKFQHTDQFEFIDSLSWLKGDHAIKVGADIIAPMQNQFMDVPATRGSLRFRGTFSGNPIADFLLGYVSDLQLSNVFVTEQRHSAEMFFIQDDWKASSRL